MNNKLKQSILKNGCAIVKKQTPKEKQLRDKLVLDSIKLFGEGGQ